MYKRIKMNFLKELNLKTDNVFALSRLNKYLSNDCFLAATSSSLSFNTIAIIINDILINNRKNIIEFGSGISTIILARFFKYEKLRCHLYSIDNNSKWILYLSEIIEKEKLNDYVTIIYSPLSKCAFNPYNINWYEVSKINDTIGDAIFDMVIIDGPEAHTNELKFARYPAIPYIKEKLNNCYSIFIDDATRSGEKKLIEMWSNILKVRFILINQELCYAIKGEHFNII